MNLFSIQTLHTCLFCSNVQHLNFAFDFSYTTKSQWYADTAMNLLKIEGVDMGIDVSVV